MIATYVTICAVLGAIGTVCSSLVNVAMLRRTIRQDNNRSRDEVVTMISDKIALAIAQHEIACAGGRRPEIWPRQAM